jgi:stage II sporulation protein P
MVYIIRIYQAMHMTVDAFTEVFSEFYWDAKAVDNPTGDSEAR